MIKIFIESGVNQAQGKNKRTTNEQDFVEKFIQHHFPHYRPSIDFEVVGVGGKDSLDKVSTILQENTFAGGTNLVIFDADSSQRKGGFSRRKNDLLAQKASLGIEFELFLWPNNHADGDFETLLLRLTTPQHKGLLDCFRRYVKCIKRLSKRKIKYNILGRKDCIYSYINAMPKSRKEQELFGKGFWFFENPLYWDLDAEFARPLRDFLGTYFP